MKYGCGVAWQLMAEGWGLGDGNCTDQRIIFESTWLRNQWQSIQVQLQLSRFGTARFLLAIRELSLRDGSVAFVVRRHGRSVGRQLNGRRIKYGVQQPVVGRSCNSRRGGMRVVDGGVAHVEKD